MDNESMLMHIIDFYSAINKNKIKNFAGKWAWWYIPLTAAVGRQKPVDFYEFKEIYSKSLS